MKVHVKDISGISIQLDIPHETSIKDIKHMIFEQLDVAPKSQNLVFQGQILQDQDHVDLCGIHNGSVLYLTHQKPINYQNQNFEQFKNQILNNNEFQNLVEMLPRVFNEFEINELLQLNLLFLSSDENLKEFCKIADMGMNNCELSPSNYNDMIQDLKEIDNYIEEKRNPHTVIPTNPSVPSECPLPNPFFFEEIDEDCFDENEYARYCRCFI